MNECLASLIKKSLNCNIDHKEILQNIVTKQSLKISVINKIILALKLHI